MNVWIQTVDHWSQKQLLYQLCHTIAHRFVIYLLIKCKNYSKETGVCHFKTILAYSQHFFFICSICFFQPNHYAQLNLLSAACKQISKIQEFQFSDTIIFSAFFCCRRQWWCCCFLFISFQSLTHSAFFKSGAQQYKTSWKHYCDQ